MGFKRFIKKEKTMGSNHDHAPADVDPQAVKTAHDLWSNFTQLTTYSVIAIIIILGLMAAFVA